MEADTVELLNVDHHGSQIRGLNTDVSSQPNSGLRKQNGLSCTVAMAAAMAALGGILFGYDIGIISGALLQLKVHFSLDCRLAEMVVGSMLLGAILASLVGGFLVDHIGRRVTIIINSMIFIVGALVLAFSYSVPVLIIGRVVVGFGVSLSAIAECVYISEIAPHRYRGSLVSLNELGITIGFLLAYLVNYSFILVQDGWRYMFGLSAIFAFVQGVGMFLLPTSPRFLMIKNNEAGASKVLQQLRRSPDVKTELSGIKQSLEAEQGHGVLDLFRSHDNMRGRMLIGCGLVFLQQFTGQPNVMYYAPTIFQTVGFHSDTAATLATVALGSVKVVFTVISLLCVDKVGRRTFLLLGSLVMTLSVVAMAITTLHTQTDPRNDPCYVLPNTNCTCVGNTSECTGNNTLWTKEHSVNMSLNNSVSAGESYGALISLFVFVAAYAVGFGPVTWLILSEIFPSSLKGRAVSLATILNWSTNLVVTMTFLNIIDSIGVSSTFFIYAIICSLSVLYIFALVPETKNRTLEQISADLKEQSMSAKIAKNCSRFCSQRFRTTLHVNVDYHQVETSESNEI